MASTPVASKANVAKADEASTHGVAGALVMGSDYRALGIVRSLGRHGIPVWVVKQGGHLVAAPSRYVQRRVSWPDGDEPGHTDFLLDLGARHDLRGWVLIPTDDYAVGLVSRHHDVLTHRYRLTAPPWKELRWLCDKRLLHLLASQVGIPQAWTASPRSQEEIAAVLGPFPLVIKPGLRPGPPSLSTPKAWRADDRDALLSAYSEARNFFAPEDLMIQELIPGGGETQFSFAALCREGVALASIVARRTRQYPMEFGQFSTFVETVDEPRVADLAMRLLRAIRFTGLVEVEFKRDPRDGEYKVLDVNPRVWGWHTLSRRCGIDFPYLLWLLAQGEPVPQLGARAGERWVHLSGDLAAVIPEILNGRLSLLDYLRSMWGPREAALFAWDDPLPGLLDLPLFAWAGGKRLLRGKKNSASRPQPSFRLSH